MHTSPKWLGVAQYIAEQNLLASQILNLVGETLANARIRKIGEIYSCTHPKFTFFTVELENFEG